MVISPYHFEHVKMVDVDVFFYIFFFLGGMYLWGQERIQDFLIEGTKDYVHATHIPRAKLKVPYTAGVPAPSLPHSIV